MNKPSGDNINTLRPILQCKWHCSNGQNAITKMFSFPLNYSKHQFYFLGFLNYDYLAESWNFISLNVLGQKPLFTQPICAGFVKERANWPSERPLFCWRSLGNWVSVAESTDGNDRSSKPGEHGSGFNNRAQNKNLYLFSKHRLQLLYP